MGCVAALKRMVIACLAGGVSLIWLVSLAFDLLTPASISRVRTAGSQRNPLV